MLLRRESRPREVHNHDMAEFSQGLRDAGEAHAGALLIATPMIEGPTFSRTIILLLDHGSDGSLGVVLNDVSEVSADKLVPGWERVLHPSVALGGPVGEDAGIAVGLLSRPVVVPPPGVRRIHERWAVIDLAQDQANVAESISDAQLFLGYAGWDAGQLNTELATGSWWVVPSDPGDLALGRMAGRTVMWRSILRRQPNELRFAATYPGDPTTN